MPKPLDWTSAVVLANFLRRRENFRMYDYQVASVLCPSKRKIHQDGRDVGKTTEIEIIHLFFALAAPGTESLIATQWEHNLTPTVDRIVAACTRHPEVARHVTRIVRSPFLRIEFDNNSILMGKIAGSGGVNFQNTHVHLISVDEAQNLLESSWQQLFPTLLTGGRLHIYGVPNGLRNRYYHLTQNPDFTRFHWPSRLNPDYTDEKDEEMASLYGGRNSPGYIHNILGEHGAPEESVFALDLVERCAGGPAELTLTVRSGETGDCLEMWIGNLSLERERGDRLLLGVDVGYAQDPTVIVAWTRRGEMLTARGILELRHTRYLRQAEILVEIMDAAGVEWVGLDRGGGGQSVIENLTTLRRDLAARVVRGTDERYGFLFHEMVEYESHDTTVKKRMKIAATEEYRALMETGEVEFSAPKRVDQLINHSFTLNARGEVIYGKGEDHIIDADRCVMYGLLLQRVRKAGRGWDRIRVEDV